MALNRRQRKRIGATNTGNLGVPPMAGRTPPLGMGMGSMGGPMMKPPVTRPPVSATPIRRPPLMKAKGMPLAGFAPGPKKGKKGKKKGTKIPLGLMI